MQRSQNSQTIYRCRDAECPAASRKYQSGNLILVGMMGSGKTTVGKSLARYLGKTFVDSDAEITKRTGVTISHIFDVEGEDGFRLRETAAITDLAGSSNMVLATGGGAVLAAQNREMLQQNGIIVYLKANARELWQRTRHSSHRPLLQNTEPYAKLKELLLQRDPLYQQIADIVIQTGKQSAHVLMLKLVDEIELFNRSTHG